MKKTIIFSMMVMALFSATSFSQAADYKIDAENAHAFIAFKVNHLGFSWVMGRFNKFEGKFSYDEKNPGAFHAEVTVDTTSVDSNQAERDKHLRSKDFFYTEKFPAAKFVSTSFVEKDGDKAELVGELTLRGITRQVKIDFEHVGHGKDPWGNYRRGFSGSTVLILKDFGIEFDLGPQARQIEVLFSVEGIQQK